MVASAPPTAPPYTRNTVLLKRRAGFDEEYPADVAIYPAMLLQLNSDGGVAPHATPGGRCERMVAKEDALQGNWFDDLYAIGSIVFTYVATAGEEVLLCCDAGCPAIAVGQLVVSNGDGTIIPSPQDGNLIYDNGSTGTSATITNSTAEAVFSNGSFTIPANTSQVGDVITIKVAVRAPLYASGTVTYRVRFGGLTGTVVLTSGAITPAAGDVGFIDFTLLVTAIGASGSIQGTGQAAFGTSGTGTPKVFTLAASTYNTTIAEAFVVTAQWSVASAANTAVMDNEAATLARSGTTNFPVGVAQAAINNSAGSFLAYVPVRFL